MLDRFLFSATQRLCPIWIIYCTTSVDVIWWNRKLWNINLRGIWKKIPKQHHWYFFMGVNENMHLISKCFDSSDSILDLFLRHWKIFLICCKYFYFFFLKNVLLIKGTAYFMHLTESEDRKKRTSQALGVWSSASPPPFPSKYHSDRKCLNRFVSDSSVALCNWYRSLFTRCCKVENQIMKVSLSALCDSD